MKANKISNGIAVLTVEFGKVTKLPDKRFVNSPDTWAYVRGNDGRRDAYIPLAEGFQVVAGLERPELLKKKLNPEKVFLGQEVFYFRNGNLNEAVFWGSTQFLDQAILKIVERPVHRYRVLRFSFYLGKPTSVNHCSVALEGTLEQAVTTVRKLPKKGMDMTYENKWEVAVDGKWVACECPIRPDGTIWYEPVLIKPQTVAPSTPQTSIGPVVAVVAAPPEPIGPVTEVIAVTKPSPEPAEQVPSKEEEPKMEVTDKEALALVASVNRNAGADNTGGFRQTMTRAERRRAHREAGVR